MMFRSGAQSSRSTGEQVRDL